MTQAQALQDRPIAEHRPSITTIATGKAEGFWQVGHRPTLIAAFLYFDLAFMVWVLLGPLAPIIAATSTSPPRKRA